MKPEQEFKDQAVTTQLAKRWVQTLETQATLPSDVTNALQEARQKALAIHARQSAPGLSQQGNKLVLHGLLHQHKLAWWAISLLSAILIAWWFSHAMPNDEVSADEDTLLLASELPPEAFVDNGFRHWINTGASGS